MIGAGISGLAAAHRLVELGLGQRLSVFEASPRLGGVLATVHEDGYQVEQSADNFITTIPWGLDLCRKLSLADNLIQTNPAHRRTFVVRRGRLHRLPDGFLMMAPTRMWPLAVTPILSPMGKLRAGLEYFIPPRLSNGDESMASFVRRRLGREVFDRLVEPLVSAVYAADLERLSVEATLSRFREMEREHGSLIRAMRRQMKARRHSPRESGARYSMFVTLREGLCSMIDAIEGRLPQGCVRLGTAVERLQRMETGWDVWSRTGDRRLEHQAIPPQPEMFDALVLATPSHVTARLLEPVDPQLARDLGNIGHSGTAIVSLGFDREQVGHPLNGMGVVVPAIEQSPILACSFSSQKYAHRAPEGKLLLRVFVGGARRPELAEMDDAELLPLVLNHLKPLLDLRGEPRYCDIAHWPNTMPQYHVGHNELVARIEARAAKLPGLHLAGNAFHGVGIPDCIHGGELAAEAVAGV